MGTHQLLVTLDVKPNAFDEYVDAMRKEEAGARSEAGNHGFDLWGDATRPRTIYLLEFWASEQALLTDHAQQPYYQHVRSLEAEALTGAFDERLLVAAGRAPEQQPGERKTLGAALAHLSVWRSAPADLELAFDHSAPAVRAAAGCRFWQLYRNTRREGEMVLIEGWDDGASRQRAAALGPAQAMQTLIADQASESVDLRKL